jgi:hypothetical protein
MIKNQVKTKSYKEKNMKMKTVISMLTVGVCAIAVQQAQANLIATETVNTTAIGGGPQISIQSTVTTEGSLYEYTYVVTSAAVSEPDLDSFTVKGGNTASITDITGTGIFSGVVNGNHVSWTTPGGADVIGTETFTFDSPYLPVQGTSFEQDTFNFGPSAALVPGARIPDGGLTVALLGGAMTAMTLIRRRVAS